MKKVIALIAPILLAQNVASQNNFNYHGSSWIGAEKVQVFQDGRVEIQGDSINAIKSLLKVIESMGADKEDALQGVKKAVEWSNKVPDYWKKNREWSLFLKHIERYGFKFVHPVKK